MYVCVYVCVYVYPGGGLETGFTSLQSSLNYSGSSHPGLQLGGGGLPRVNLKDGFPYFPRQLAEMPADSSLRGERCSRESCLAELGAPVSAEASLSNRDLGHNKGGRRETPTTRQV